MRSSLVLALFLVLSCLCAVPANAIDFKQKGTFQHPAYFEGSSKELMAKYFAEQEEPMVFYVTTAVDTLCSHSYGFIPRYDYDRVYGCTECTRRAKKKKNAADYMTYLGYLVVTPQKDTGIPILTWYPVPQFDEKVFWDPRHSSFIHKYSTLAAYFAGFSEALQLREKAVPEARSLWWKHFVRKVFYSPFVLATRPGVAPDPDYRPHFQEQPKLPGDVMYTKVRFILITEEDLYSVSVSVWMNNPHPEAFNMFHEQFIIRTPSGI